MASNTYFCCIFRRLVYHMFPVSLDCPFLIAFSVLATVYLHRDNQQYLNFDQFTKVYLRFMVCLIVSTYKKCPVSYSRCCLCVWIAPSVFSNVY